VNAKTESARSLRSLVKKKKHHVAALAALARLTSVAARYARAPATENTLTRGFGIDVRCRYAPFDAILLKKKKKKSLIN